MLRAARAVGARHGVRVRTTLLAAHATPPEYAGRTDAYVDYIVEKILPAAVREKLADAVNAFGENIAFSPAQVAPVFEAARAYGLPHQTARRPVDRRRRGGPGRALRGAVGQPPGIHVRCWRARDGAVRDGGGAAAGRLCNRWRAPTAAIQAFRTHGVAMAVATDCNPGSSPPCSLLVAANLACALFRLKPEEAVSGITRNAARALELAQDIGTLEPGRRAEFAVWEIGHPRALAYWMGGLAPCDARPCLRDGPSAPTSAA